MKNHFEHFQAFIEEQKKWFEQHLSADFAQTWNVILPSNSGHAAK